MSQLTTVRLGAEVVVVFGAAESPFAGIVARGTTVMDLLPSVVLEASTERSLVCFGGIRFENGREEWRQRLLEEFMPRLLLLFFFLHF